MGADALIMSMARIGAGRRIVEIGQEQAQLRALFPGLFKGVPKSKNGEVASVVVAASPQDGNGHHMQTPAAREAASLRMKARWRKKRREEAGRN
jgi:hypothetical protein